MQNKSNLLHKNCNILQCGSGKNNGYKVEGNFMMLDFIIYDETDNIIGKITRKYFSIGDKYEIDIIDETKIVLILSIIVTIANDINRKQRD